MADTEHGRTEPRVWTRPLRKLTPKTSRGYEVADYAERILHVTLYPWQKWLLVHALELLPDDSYRFDKVIVLVGRQNGKTTVGGVLSDWWLHVDSQRHPDKVPPVKFRIVGVAQSLERARDPWNMVRLWCNPEPNASEAPMAIPSLQERTLPICMTNGKEHITSTNLASYWIRAVKSARGDPAARVLMDEVREQKTEEGWNAIEPTTSAMWSGQIWELSNAGDVTSIVLIGQREAALRQIADWETFVDSGRMTARVYADAHPDRIDMGLFEWSALDGCDLDDVEGILQANPSIGYHPGKTVSGVLSKRQGRSENAYRTEYLCQWVTADVDPPFPTGAWEAGTDSDSQRDPKAEVFYAVDTSSDRRFSAISIVSRRGDGLWHGEVVAYRPGIDWLIRWFRDRPARRFKVAYQGRGAPVSSIAELLDNLDNVETYPCEGRNVAGAFGRLWDSVAACSDDSTSDAVPIMHRPQPALDQAAQTAQLRKLGDGARGFDRDGTPGVDISPLVALSFALWLATTGTVEKMPTVFPSAYGSDHGPIFI